MPLYEYECSSCGEFTLSRGLAERNLPAPCPECDEPSVRVILAPNLSLMPGHRRQAFARNEKSQHEPGSLTRHRCGSRCGCGQPAKVGKQTKRTVDLGKAGRFEAPSARKRPWMLGH
jgi:putative FmdB family regulatory protein